MDNRCRTRENNDNGSADKVGSKASAESHKHIFKVEEIYPWFRSTQVFVVPYLWLDLLVSRCEYSTASWKLAMHTLSRIRYRADALFEEGRKLRDQIVKGKSSKAKRRKKPLGVGPAPARRSTAARGIVLTGAPAKR